MGSKKVDTIASGNDQLLCFGTWRRLPRDLHGHDILVNLRRVVSVERSELELVGSNLTIKCLERNARHQHSS